MNGTSVVKLEIVSDGKSAVKLEVNMDGSSVDELLSLLFSATVSGEGVGEDEDEPVVERLTEILETLEDIKDKMGELATSDDVEPAQTVSVMDEQTERSIYNLTNALEANTRAMNARTAVQS